MKKISLLLLAVSFFFFYCTANAQQAPSKKKTQKESKSQSSSPAFNGAWQSVDDKEFAIVNDGFFSSVAQDSTGIWRNTHAGTYTVEGNNSITFKVLYSSFPGRIGSLQTVDYELNGDTLIIKWFKKLVDAREGDITNRMPKGQQTKYVHAKQ
ncbi:hypothetical protein OCK74_00585 [Chitinophagaceae bacterium LB-8]|uniref:Lipocalin-like domain-containing protein n=1 Tax=Paraflavisolibacter caeni TaxID=2982496 RepID=A0A9X3BGD6_9BACT|nr:hypothetical protein [Paraflavisolibacter caeni]MCU7547582.1 hypothetical protein [Paraflavisolibacter caeni]